MNAEFSRRNFGEGGRAAYEARVATMLTEVPAAAPVVRSAIFRVVTAGDRFAFTRTLVVGGERVATQFGPYGSQRAAHELAQRAAAQFRIENSGCLVGVVDLDPADGPATEAARPLWEVIAEKRLEKKRARQRQVYAKRTATSEKRERQREKDRRRHARAMATPEGRERLRKKWRSRAPAIGTQVSCEIVEDDASPTCATCGKATGYHLGKPMRFCRRKAGEVRSSCQVRHSNQLWLHRLRAEPELRDRVKQQREEWDREHPDEARARAKRKYLAIRNDPRRWAEKLAAKRGYSSSGRSAVGSGRYSMDLPTGSVLATASHRAPGRELLASVYAAVPTNMSPATREEIISETAMLVFQGAELSTAVKQATKTVRKNAGLLRYTKPIDDCFWLADETAFSLEASL